VQSKGDDEGGSDAISVGGDAGAVGPAVRQRGGPFDGEVMRDGGTRRVRLAVGAWSRNSAVSRPSATDRPLRLWSCDERGKLRTASRRRPPSAAGPTATRARGVRNDVAYVRA